jgi:hypothetical protein
MIADDRLECREFREFGDFLWSRHSVGRAGSSRVERDLKQRRQHVPAAYSPEFHPI